MFAAGVTCSDCHDPHSAKLRFLGDNTCLQCHSCDVYANDRHTRHAGVNPPLACISCHMPTRTYMVVDVRHDHSFRIPRPDISAKLGTSNASRRRGRRPSSNAGRTNRKGLQTFGEAFDAAWTGKATAAAQLAAVAASGGTPAIARASALAELAPHVSPAFMAAQSRPAGGSRSGIQSRVEAQFPIRTGGDQPCRAISAPRTRRPR